MSPHHFMAGRQTQPRKATARALRAKGESEEEARRKHVRSLQAAQTPRAGVPAPFSSRRGPSWLQAHAAAPTQHPWMRVPAQMCLQGKAALCFCWKLWDGEPRLPDT